MKTYKAAVVMIDIQMHCCALRIHHISCLLIIELFYAVSVGEYVGPLRKL